ncbi:MAG: type II toxin-antitoxin system HicB family antitoxin [Actinomycetota bacterium]|nr:type II toxin-antitoxin system HicB family antitoxin [Actinomycetota bacterium]
MSESATTVCLYVFVTLSSRITSASCAHVGRRPPRAATVNGRKRSTGAPNAHRPSPAGGVTTWPSAVERRDAEATGELRSTEAGAGRGCRETHRPWPNPSQGQGGDGHRRGGGDGPPEGRTEVHASASVCCICATRRQRTSVLPVVQPAISYRCWLDSSDGLIAGRERRRAEYAGQLESARDVEFAFEPQVEGGYHAYAPELPGLHTQGDSLEDATANAEEALALYVEWLREEGRSLQMGIVRRRLPLPA